MKKVILSLLVLGFMGLGAQATESELVYAVCRVEAPASGLVEAKVSVVREGLKFTVGEQPLVLEWEAIDLLKRTITELNK